MSTKRKRKLKLKPRPEQGYNNNLCAGLDCYHESDFIDATKNTWPFDVPLCDTCGELRPPPPHRVLEPKPEPKPEHKSVKEVEEPDEYEMSEYTKIKARVVAEVEGATAPKSVKLFG